MYKKIQHSAEAISKRSNIAPLIGIQLGTGLGSFVDHLDNPTVIPYSEIPNFPVTTVEGHSGNLVLGQIGGVPIVVLQGRFHFYEGYSMQEVTFPIRVLNELGIKCLLLSNAAGGINPDFNVGDLMMITDHINLFGDNPLRGSNIDDLGPRFPDMSEPYDKQLIALATKEAEKADISHRQGVYIGNSGPSFETPAEYTFYRTIGGDAVGMSTVPEVIVANHMNLRVFAVSVITNIAVPGNFEMNSHLDVQEAAEKATQQLSHLYTRIIVALHQGF